jgi:hypothetical protein
MVQALMAATGLEPRVAGKPNRPLLDEAVRRSNSTTPLVVGDRLDTDIEAAVLAGMPSLLVLTGVSTAADLLVAPESRRPTYVSFDMRGLVDEAKVAEIVTGDAGENGESAWSVDVSNAELRLRSNGNGAGDLDEDGRDLSALAALAATAWSTGITEVRGDDPTAVATLTRFGLVSTTA